MQRWDIYRAYINYEDNEGGKRRPILMLNISLSLLITVKITSKERDGELEYKIRKWRECGLDRPSWVRLEHKVYLPTDVEMVKLGTLLKEDIDNIKMLCQKYEIKLNESLLEKLSLRTTSCSENECYSNILLDGNKIGEIAFSFYDDINAVGIGNFEISPENRRKGYGTKVLEFVIDRYKKEFDLIYCFVDVNNDEAIKLYKKLGKVFDEDGPNVNNQYYVEFYNNGVDVE